MHIIDEKVIVSYGVMHLTAVYLRQRFKSWPYSRIERGELKFHLGFESSIGQKSTKALPKSLNTEIGYMIYIKCMQLILVLRNKKL